MSHAEATRDRGRATAAPVEAMRPYFTRHAQLRLWQRFPKRLSKEARSEFNWGNPSVLLREAFALFREGEERRQIFNDTRFMTYIFDTYGYDKRYAFHANGDIVFVCVEDHENMRIAVITVVDMRAGNGSYSQRNMGARMKFGRKAA